MRPLKGQPEVQRAWTSYLLSSPPESLKSQSGAGRLVEFSLFPTIGPVPGLRVSRKLMGEVPAGGNPSQQEPARAIGNSHQERLEANLGGDSAVPGWAGVGQAKAWNARATRLARRLESRGVSAEQLFVLLDVVLPTGWDSEAGITLSDEESGWHLRELVSIGSAAAASLRMRRVTQANASVPRCKNRCHRAANVPYDTCCQACS